MNIDISYSTNALHWRIQSECLLDNCVKILEFVQLAVRNRLIFIVTKNLTSFVEQLILNVLVTRNRVQCKSNTHGRCVVPLENACELFVIFIFF